jgi:hypothetical protein
MSAGGGAPIIANEDHPFQFLAGRLRVATTAGDNERAARAGVASPRVPAPTVAIESADVRP